VLGSPEISADGFTPYRTAIRDAFGNWVAHGVPTTISAGSMRPYGAHLL
jgi:hypothetical protein